MPRTLSAEALAESRAILLVGARQSGKSQTLASWSTQFNVFKRSETGELLPVINQGKVAFRSYEITEYVIEVGESLFRVFDVPGEVLESRRVGDPNETTGAGRMLGHLLTLQPRVAGVIAFVVPPCEEGVGCIEDRTQLTADMGKALGEVHVVEQLRGVLEFVQGFIGQRLHRAGEPAPVVVAQVGFADLVVWREGDLSRLCELHKALKPGTSSELSWSALRTREPLFAGLDELARSTFKWLDRARRAVPGVDFVSVPVSNEAVRQRNMPTHNTGASLLCAVDQIERSRLRGMRTRTQSMLAAAGVFFVFLAAFGVARWAPNWLPAPLAVSACSTIGQPADRCECVEVVARNATDHAFRRRLDLISPFVLACAPGMLDAAPHRRPQLMSLVAQVELARAAVSPGDFSSARYEAAVQAGGRPGTFSGPMPWYPADSPAQLRAIQIVQGLVDGSQRPDAVKLASGFEEEDRAEFGGLLKLLSSAKSTSACLREWRQVRESGSWKSLANHCGRTGERLPPELQTCYRADAALGYAENSSPLSGSPCSTEVACSRGRGLEAVLFRVPSPDQHTFANLAARAATSEELKQCMTRAVGANSAHLVLLGLLGPGSFEDRQALVRTVGDEQWKEVSEFVRREWVEAESGRRIGTTNRRAIAQRLPMLPLKSAAEGACALVDAPAMYSPPTAAVPWHESMEVESLTGETSLTYRARVALALLTAAGTGRTPQSAGCELAAAVALLRLPDSQDRQALLVRLNGAFQVFEGARDAPDAATTQAAVARLRCRLGPAFAPSAAVAADFATAYGCAAAVEPSASQASSSMVGR
jgi:hypothetical protein